jgi:hypothetical protein
MHGIPGGGTLIDVLALLIKNPIYVSGIRNAADVPRATTPDNDPRNRVSDRVTDFDSGSLVIADEQLDSSVAIVCGPE